MAQMLLYRPFLASSLGGHQAYIHRNICSFIYLFIYLFMGHRILHLAKSTGGSRDARALRARRDYKLASQELSSISLNIQGSFSFSLLLFFYICLCLIINYIMIP